MVEQVLHVPQVGMVLHEVGGLAEGAVIILGREDSLDRFHKLGLSHLTKIPQPLLHYVSDRQMRLHLAWNIELIS